MRYVIQQHRLCVQNNVLFVDCCDRHQLDQTSTHPVSKLRPNFDQTSTPPVSKFGRSLLGTSMTYIVNLVNYLPNCDTKLRPNFDQTSTPHRSKYISLSNQ